MSNRKKKRRRGPSSPAGGNGTRGAARRQAAVDPKPAADRASTRAAAMEGARRAAGDRPRGLFGGRLREPSPLPGFGKSMAAGLTSTAASPWAHVPAFLAVAGLWATFTAAGLGDLMGSRVMADLMALPPIYLLLADRVIAFYPVADSSLVGMGIAVAMSLARALVFGLAIAYQAHALGWTDRTPLAAFRRAAPHLLAIGLAMFGVGAAIPFLVGGLLPGGIGSLLVLAGPLLGVYFLSFAPVAAVVDGSGYRDSIRRSARASRLPGGRHLALCLGYFTFALYGLLLIPVGAVEPATPPIATWAIGLGMTFLHLVVLGGFVFRWLAVRELVPADVPAPRAPRARSRS